MGTQLDSKSINTLLITDKKKSSTTVENAKIPPIGEHLLTPEDGVKKIEAGKSTLSSPTVEELSKIPEFSKNTTVAKKGYCSNDIQYVQEMLKELYSDKIVADGVFDQEFIENLNNYLKNRNLPKVKDLDTKTIGQIELDYLSKLTGHEEIIDGSIVGQDESKK